MKSLITIILTFTVTSGLLILANFGLYAQEGKYEKEFKKSYLPTANVVRIVDIQKQETVVSIRGEQDTLKTGETQEIRDRQIYSGTIQVVEIKDESVVLSLDIHKTKYFYIVHFLIFLFSFIISCLMGAIYKIKGKNKDD